MSKSTKISIFGGLILIVMMLIQFKYNQDMRANFDEFQSKRYEIVKTQLSLNGLTETQSQNIASAIRDETSMLSSTVSSNFLMHSYFMTMNGFIMLSLIAFAIKKDKKNE